MLSSRPYFAHEAELRAVPAGPLHCVCGAKLEPMRRYAGLCGACVKRRARGVERAQPTDKLRSQMTLVGVEWRRRAGHDKRERFALLRCSCGTERSIYYHLWVHRPPACCNACRLRGVEANGFEAERKR